MKKKIIISVAVVILLILVGVGIWLGISKKSNKTETEQLPSQEQKGDIGENIDNPEGEQNADEEQSKDPNVEEPKPNESNENQQQPEQKPNTEKPKFDATSTTNDLFGRYYARAEEIVSSMTLEEKVGQMFLVRYPSSYPTSQIKSENPGGYILFYKDFDNKTKESIKAELASNQANSKIKMFFAVDEEGGIVCRVSNHTAFRSSKFESPQSLYAKGGIQAIVNESYEKSDLLKSIGLNMNLAPVADVSTSSSDFIYARTLGRDATTTANYISEVVKAMRGKNIISSLKHFPGYGNNVDTHTGIAIDNRSYENFTTNDFLPFKAGISAGAPTILVSHNIIKCMDANLPASLSSSVHQVLRKNLGFTGLIITDDLAMDAVKSYAQNGEAAVKAVQSGNDIIITSDFKNQKQQVLNAISRGEISEETINTAVRRILACKLAYGIIQ